METQHHQEQPILLTVEQAAKRLGLSGPRVRRLCIDRRLGMKIGRQWLIAPDEVLSFAKVERHVGRPKKRSEPS